MNQEWLLKMAELEDGKCTSVGGLACDLGLYKGPICPYCSGKLYDSHSPGCPNYHAYPRIGITMRQPIHCPICKQTHVHNVNCMNRHVPLEPPVTHHTSRCMECNDIFPNHTNNCSLNPRNYCPSCSYLLPNHTVYCKLNTKLKPVPEKAAMDKPKTEELAPGVEQIPFEALEELGYIFAEGEKKYGRDNWKKQPDNKEYDNERTRHAIRHLMLWANGDRTEPHLAKVMWFCVTTIWREKNKGIKHNPTNYVGEKQ